MQTRTEQRRGTIFIFRTQCCNRSETMLPRSATCSTRHVFFRQIYTSVAQRPATATTAKGFIRNALFSARCYWRVRRLDRAPLLPLRTIPVLSAAIRGPTMTASATWRRRRRWPPTNNGNGMTNGMTNRTASTKDRRVLKRGRARVKRGSRTTHGGGKRAGAAKGRMGG